MVRVAIIGCGRHARAHHGVALAHYQREHPGELELVAACDRNLAAAQAFADDFGFAQAIDDADALLASAALDGCVVVMPLQAIVPMAQQLLERGLPCTIEKPLGQSLAEARALAQVAARTGTPHMVSVDRRFNPLLQQADAWCRQQGAVRSLSAAMLRHQRTEPLFTPQTSVHLVDTLRALAGEAVDLTVHHPGGGSAPAPWHHAVIRFDTGIIGEVKIFPTTGWADERYEWFGDGFHAQVRILPGRGGLLRCCRDDRVLLEQIIAPADYDYRHCGAYGETHAFITALQTGQPLKPTVAQVLPSLELCERIAGG